MKEQKENTMKKLEEMWEQRFPLGRTGGSITLKSVNGEIVNIKRILANYRIEITDPVTGKTTSLCDEEVGHVWIEDNSVWYRHRTRRMESGEIVEKSTPVEIEIEKGE